MIADWQEAALALWGDEWIAPMSEWSDINRRTIERWKAGAGAPRQRLQDRIVTIAERAGDDAQAMGDVLRRMARGGSINGIREHIAALQRAVDLVEDDPPTFFE